MGGTRGVDLRGVLVLTALTCIWGSCNDVLSKVVANVYTQRFAFFVDQGNNLLYVLFAAVPMLRFFYSVGGIPEGLRAIPQSRFVIMGLLDAFGTFLSSIGAPGCPGHLQVVLNQTLIPFTMVCSYLFLSKKTTLKEAGAACIILFGAMICIFGGGAAKTDASAAADLTAFAPGFGDDSAMGSSIAAPLRLGGSSDAAEAMASFQNYAILIYLASNVPMAFSNVYKEIGFQNYDVDVWSMTCIVCVYQTFWTFALLYLQTFPILSGYPDHGLDLSTCWRNFVGGTECFLGSQEVERKYHIDCSHGAILLLIYVGFNLSFNTVSMSLTQYGSKYGIGSVLCSLAYAVKLPLSNILFAQPLIMGSDTEQLSGSSLVGLVAVTAGFLVYLWAAGEARDDAAAVEDIDRYLELPAAAGQEAAREQGFTSDTGTWAFHERVVGCDLGSSFRKMPENPLTRTLSELGLAGSSRATSLAPSERGEEDAGELPMRSVAEAVLRPFRPERAQGRSGRSRSPDARGPRGAGAAE